ncbi:MAG: ATP-binding protein [Candidatus Stygibacter frigidus]|nr:ATP-binding protein [Candidatus Stygibacter frigidus]
MLFPQVGLKSEDLSSLDQFRKLALKSNRLDKETLQESDKNLLDKLHLYSGKYLKKAAALLFYNDPEKYITGAYIKIGFFETDSELIYQDEVHGNLFEQIDKIMDLVFTKYLRAYISYDGIYRVETFPVPKEAFREGILNAIAHKDYASGVPIQISVYDDKLMIFNNGYLHSGWTITTLLEKHSSQPYNPDIANAFFRATLIETWGRGIEKIQNACKKEGFPLPEISFDGSGFWLKFTYKESLSRIAPEMTEEMSEEMSDIIIRILRKNPAMSLKEVAQLVHKSSRTIERTVKKLKKDGKIDRIGPKKGGYWKVIEEVN